MNKDGISVRLESDDFPCDHIEIASLAGSERISQLFELDVEIVARAEGAPSRDVLAGAGVTIVFLRHGDEVRRLHGMIARVNESLDAESDARAYRLRVVPRAHRLTLVEMQEIYMDISVPDILKTVLDKVGLGEDVEMRLQETYPKLEFVVQYKESDLSFASRLAEHHGLSFFFEHDDGHDRLVFTDGRGFSKLAGRPRVPLRPRGDHRDVFHLEVETSLIPMTYAVVDYNYRRPLLDLTASYESPAGYAGGVAEYGTHVKTPDQAAAFAKVRGQERESSREVFVGRSDLCELSAGATFEIDGGGRRDDLRLLVVEVEHRLRQTVGLHGGKDMEAYANTFRAVSADLVYRSPRRTPRPRIAGVVSAIVEKAEGSSDKYAQIDKHGRYRVRFLFDTAAPGERKASRPVRMAQPNAGAGSGMHFPLLPGTEVLLAFIDGDPDRPIIVGAAPNAVTPSPVTATNSTKNQIKTSTGVLLEMK